jgi:hypothetical protein
MLSEFFARGQAAQKAVDDLMHPTKRHRDAPDVKPAAQAVDTCSNCRYFNLRGKSLCRRYPPVPGSVISPSQGTAYVFFPTVDPGDWCGEWQAITGATAKGEHDQEARK